ncbi:lipopolysaccharide biosynthesis protein [Roseibium sp.]|uniref:lipopolysaccharide biosynthesis protein n=1 Tax=Roseibium sp. TaxID=1936156 RepID=UPI003A986472
MKLKILRTLIEKGAAAAIVKLSGVSLTFLFLLYAARTSSTEDYGKFASILSLATIFGYVLAFGHHITILRFWPSIDELRGRETANAALRHTFKIILRICIGWLVLGVIVSFSGLKVGDFDNRALVFWFFLLSAAFALSEFSIGALRSQESIFLALFPREIGWRILSIAMVFASTIIFTTTNLPAITAIALLLVTVIQAIIILRKTNTSKKTKLEKSIKTDISRAGWGLWIGSVVDPISAHSATVIVAIVLGAPTAGAFFAADKIAKLLALALMGVNLVISPLIARNYYSQNLQEVRLLTLFGCLISVIAAGVGFLIYLYFGKFALSLFNPEYVEYYKILIVLSLGQIVNCACGPVGTLVQMAGYQNLYATISTITSLVGLLLLFLLTNWYGTLGAAVASAATLSVWNLAMLSTAYLKILKSRT